MTKRRQEIKQWLKDVLEDNLRDIPYRAFIFGSQANKDELIRSDIDVGIIADKAVPDINFVRIGMAIEELPMLYKIDLVDLRKLVKGLEK